MAFWNEATSAPKRNYRWLLTIDGFGTDSVVWWAKTVNTPSFDVSEVEHNYFDNKFYFPGRVSGSEVEATLVDPVSPDAVDLTLDILKKSGYNIANSKSDPKETISKNKAVTSGVQAVKIELFDAGEPNANPTPLETWQLKNVFIKAAKFGDLDYSNDELRTISLTLRYDWATCEIQGGNSYFTNGQSSNSGPQSQGGQGGTSNTNQ